MEADLIKLHLADVGVDRYSKRSDNIGCKDSSMQTLTTRMVASQPSTRETSTST
jgi:hypothetical protein